MFGFGKGSQQEYQEDLTGLAHKWQLGIYKKLFNQHKIITPNATEVDVGFIVAGITNWVFRFGDYGPKVAENPAIKPRVDALLQHCARLLGNEDDIAEITLAVIIAAAAQNVPMAVFATHFDKLAALGIVKRNINLYVPKGGRAIHIDEFLVIAHLGSA